MVQVVCQGRTGAFARDSTDCPRAPARALLQFADSLGCLRFASLGISSARLEFS